MQARLLPPAWPGAAGAARRGGAGRACASNGYFSEADPKQGVQQLWGQSKKRDIIKEARLRLVRLACQVR